MISLRRSPENRSSCDRIAVRCGPATATATAVVCMSSLFSIQSDRIRARIAKRNRNRDRNSNRSGVHWALGLNKFENTYSSKLTEKYFVLSCYCQKQDNIQYKESKYMPTS